MKPKLLPAILIGFLGPLIACIVFTSPQKAVPTQASIQNANPTDTPADAGLPSPTEVILPADTFAFQVPGGGKLGGISGIFLHENETNSDATCARDYDLLRFYDDGLILYAPVCLTKDFTESWPNIRKWFQRDSQTDLQQGKYYLSGERIWFSTTLTRSDGNTVVVDYSGEYSGSGLVLDSYSHYTGNEQSAIQFIQVDVEP